MTTRFLMQMPQGLVSHHDIVSLLVKEAPEQNRSIHPP